ncbi:MAG: hypothetical protein ACRDHW_01290, partial [Ktedonobacteraceae bacterium]
DEQTTTSNVPSTADPAATLTPGSQQAQAIAAQVMASQVPATPAYAPPVGVPDQNQAQGGFMVPQQQQQQQSGYQMPPVYGQQPYNAPAMAAPNTGGTLQRAFASKGTPVRHQSWLIDGKFVQPTTLRNALVENIQRQGVMGVGAVPEHLREQGVVMEERDYVRVQYGSSSVFVYLAPMGQNLYISRTSTVQQPYSRIRIGVVIGLFILMLICLGLYAAINPDPLSSTFGFVDSAKIFFSYAFFGLLFFFLFLLIRSIVSSIGEMDFLAFLRPHTLNDFTLDALSAVEQITDKGIRETVAQAGLNSAEITRGQTFALRQPLYRL